MKESRQKKNELKLRAYLERTEKKPEETVKSPADLLEEKQKGMIAKKIGQQLPLLT